MCKPLVGVASPLVVVTPSCVGRKSAPVLSSCGEVIVPTSSGEHRAADISPYLVVASVDSRDKLAKSSHVLAQFKSAAFRWTAIAAHCARLRPLRDQKTFSPRFVQRHQPTLSEEVEAAGADVRSTASVVVVV